MPNRIIKESICSSDSLNALSDFEENFFFKLIVNCDDYGRFDARPAILKSRCYPLRERLTLRNIEDALQALARVGCVELYEVDGKPYLHLPAWEVHQQIRAKKSKFPAPDSNGYQVISDDSKCPRNPIQYNPNTSESAIAPTPDPKHKYGKNKWVKLTEAEYEHLIAEYGEPIVSHFIGVVDERAQMNGNKYKWKDFNLVVRKAIREKWGGDPPAIAGGVKFFD